MSNLERRFRKYAIRNLSLFLILCYAVGYILTYLHSGILTYMTLNPYAILHGEIWRLFTWVLIPPRFDNLFFILIMLYFYYSIGTSLELAWGTWNYNVYIFSGMLFTIIGAFVMMGITMLINPSAGAWEYAWMSMAYSTYYINMSIFLAYAVTFPESVVLLMFFIPVKVKWLGIIYGLIIVADTLQNPYYVKIAIIASLLNFIVFFLRSGRLTRFKPSEVLRRESFKAKAKPAHMGAAKTIHRCAVCGRTEKDNPSLEFRYCSKCAGNLEYCKDHLFTHVHVQAGNDNG